MPAVLQAMLMSLVRKVLVAAGTWIVARGWFTEAEVTSYIPDLLSLVVGLVAIAGGTGWSLWNKYTAKQA